MAKTTDFLSQTSGKLTDQFTTRQTAFGTILARTPKKTANPRRSEKQANMRCQMANMSANFKLFQGKLKLAWENKRTGLSEFNCFVASNYDKNPVYITKSMRVAGACVLAESYISSGSLAPIDLGLTDEGVLVSDLQLGSLQIGAGTTVADLTIAILQNNQDWEDGDQLTWFYGVQRVDSAGTPRATMTAQKVVLDTTNETQLWSVVSELGFKSVQGAQGGQVLGMGQALVNAGGVWVHSREKDGSSIKVSSQQMMVVSDVLAQYQTYQAMKASADSYGGINGSVAYLNPGVSFSDLSSASQSGGSSSGSSGGSTGNGGSTQNGGGTGTITGGDGGNTGGGQQTVTVAAPTISGSTPFEESTSVTMSAESGAEIRYTTDGTAPTASTGTVYSGAVTLTETTTVKAIAVKDGTSSQVSSKTFTKNSGNGGGGGEGSGDME